MPATSFSQILLGSTNGDLSIPAGIITDYAGSSAPSGWLLCYGQAVSRSTYAALFTAISTTYGIGDGATTFNLPDCRGRVKAGKDDMGGSSANRLTDQSGGLDGDILGDTGGSETHVITESQLPSHLHTIPNHGHSIPTVTEDSPGADSGFDYTTQGTDIPNSTTSTDGGTNTGSTGSGTAHNNIQPTIIFNTIIKY